MGYYLFVKFLGGLLESISLSSSISPCGVGGSVKDGVEGLVGGCWLDKVPFSHVSSLCRVFVRFCWAEHWSSSFTLHSSIHRPQLSSSNSLIAACSSLISSLGRLFMVHDLSRGCGQRDCFCCRLDSIFSLNSMKSCSSMWMFSLMDLMLVRVFGEICWYMLFCLGSQHCTHCFSFLTGLSKFGNSAENFPNYFLSPEPSQYHYGRC